MCAFCYDKQPLRILEQRQQLVSEINVPNFYQMTSRKQKTKRFFVVFRNIDVEMEHCLKMVNNHGMLATVIDKQN